MTEAASALPDFKLIKGKKIFRAMREYFGSPASQALLPHHSITASDGPAILSLIHFYQS